MSGHSCAFYHAGQGRWYPPLPLSGCSPSSSFSIFSGSATPFLDLLGFLSTFFSAWPGPLQTALILGYVVEALHVGVWKRRCRGVVFQEWIKRPTLPSNFATISSSSSAVCSVASEGHALVDPLSFFSGFIFGVYLLFFPSPPCLKQPQTCTTLSIMGNVVFFRCISRFSPEEGAEVL